MKPDRQILLLTILLVILSAPAVPAQSTTSDSVLLSRIEQMESHYQSLVSTMQWTVNLLTGVLIALVIAVIGGGFLNIAMQRRELQAVLDRETDQRRSELQSEFDRQKADLDKDLERTLDVELSKVQMEIAEIQFNIADERFRAALEKAQEESNPFATLSAKVAFNEGLKMLSIACAIQDKGSHSSGGQVKTALNAIESVAKLSSLGFYPTDFKMFDEIARGVPTNWDFMVERIRQILQKKDLTDT